jgi:NhaA family Na+:H+ antiporter
MPTYTPGQSPTPSPPAGAQLPLRRLLRFARRPLERFLRIEAASGILLLASALGALLWANSPWAESYGQLWHAPLRLRWGAWSFDRTIEWIINDGLMVIFFFVVGLEIRREIQGGELSTWRRAALPVAAALGGMLMPAVLYLLCATGAGAKSGWGVPMATDIAFAVGVLSLLGKRVPAPLRVLLLALAVIDDLGAIVVIAVFYSEGIGLLGLLVAALGLGGIFALQRLGVRNAVAYVAPAVVVWAGIYDAGVHPTIAGVIVGWVTPVRAALDGTSGDARSPAERLVEALHPWVAFVILPLFALANAGVSVSRLPLDGALFGIGLAVAVGLVIGKPLGILLASWLTLRLGVGTLPAGVSLRQLAVLGVMAGIGFTMAIFIAQLAFTDPGLLAAAKVGVLAASGIAAVLGLVLGRLLLSPTGRVPGA